MPQKFSSNEFYGYLAKGELRRAVEYLRLFPEKREQYESYISVYEDRQYPEYDVDDCLRGLLGVYQEYYREAFYFGIGAEKALENMLARFGELFGIEATDFDMLESEKISAAFFERGYEFQGGRTGGYYGPYVWKNSAVKSYEVELPEGTSEYSVRTLYGFICKGWLDYISFGDVGVGGWTGEDGLISCISECYDFGSEAFTVSLLKHEAQHAADFEKYKGISSEDLEYRAKLVELIYSEARELIVDFAAQAGGENAHSKAAQRIVDGMAARGKEPTAMAAKDVRTLARELFYESSRALDNKRAEALCWELGKYYPGAAWEFFGGHYHRNAEGVFAMDGYEIPVITIPGLCDIELDRTVTLSTKLTREQALNFAYASLSDMAFEVYGVEDWLSDYYHPGMSFDELRSNVAESTEREIFFSFTVEEKVIRDMVEKLKKLGFYY